MTDTRHMTTEAADAYRMGREDMRRAVLTMIEADWREKGQGLDRHAPKWRMSEPWRQAYLAVADLQPETRARGPQEAPAAPAAVVQPPQPAPACSSEKPGNAGVSAEQVLAIIAAWAAEEHAAGRVAPPGLMQRLGITMQEPRQ